MKINTFVRIRKLLLSLIVLVKTVMHSNSVSLFILNFYLNYNLFVYFISGSMAHTRRNDCKENSSDE